MVVISVEAGLNIGDRIVSVNGESVAGRSYAQVNTRFSLVDFIHTILISDWLMFVQVVQMIQKSRDNLYLVVVPKQDDILQVVRICLKY